MNTALVTGNLAPAFNFFGLGSAVPPSVFLK
jgi:hypothetical protein